MRTCWVIADGFANPLISPDTLKDIAPVWGSWKTWQAWNTDNVICHEKDKARDLIGRAFQAVCNFYAPKKYYMDLGQPLKVNLYEGDFPGELDNPEEIIAMHLVAESNDLVLLLGFDLTEIDENDKSKKQRSLNYQNAFRATLNTYPECQWVVIDHAGDLDKSFKTIPNISCDNFDNVLKLLL